MSAEEDWKQLKTKCFIDHPAYGPIWKQKGKRDLWTNAYTLLPSLISNTDVMIHD